ncbi:hypothetical protein PY254_16485 [Rhodanobacter sp. AS-Z3]|uniref:hypothetical protein n=1 Tax=Rhodanobacter sp. AS-Z3 TaxID=3031330 RepID=UPI00247856D0|nr:hypothetical protein [Rhodanobacter sp. AS-Z3]WEN14808.1 hypothetical protein PY254_16485 [Rhodanobacter sp. AS-Z3]
MTMSLDDESRVDKAAMDLIESAAILRATIIAMEEGSALAELSEGWGHARQVVDMRATLSASAQERIESELPSLRYWTAPATPHSPATHGFICDIDKTGISFPDCLSPGSATT